MLVLFNTFDTSLSIFVPRREILSDVSTLPSVGMRREFR